MTRRDPSCAKASVKRTTKETDVEVAVDLDGTGASSISTGIGFLDHMLDLLARHSRIDLAVKAKGDLHIDHHHTTEDVGIALGQAVKQALGDMKGITRYADVHVPMDEALTRVAIDISGRPFLVFKAEFVRDKVGTFDTELVQEWFQAFAMNSGVTLHVATLYGTNDHHIAESCFKGLARALACRGRDRSARGERGAVDQGLARRLSIACRASTARATSKLELRKSETMAVYTVHEPPLKRDETAPDPERFVFVRDGFSFWAFLLAPLWMLRHRLWLVFTCYIIVVIALQVGLRALGASSTVMAVVSLLIALLVGLEAATLRRFTLSRPRLEERRHRGRRRSRRGGAAFLRRLGRQLAGRHRAARRCVVAIGGSDPAPAAGIVAGIAAGAGVVRRHRPVSGAGSVAVTVAIVDYGSGNLHSAAKAFERAAREHGRGAADRGDAAIPTRSPAPTAWCCPGVGAFADCRRGLDAVGGMVEALNESVRGARPAVPRHLRRHAAHGRARPRIRGDRGARLDRRARSIASRRPTRA